MIESRGQTLNYPTELTGSRRREIDADVELHAGISV
jgi:hypothetical protein